MFFLSTHHSHSQYFFPIMFIAEAHMYPVGLSICCHLPISVGRRAGELKRLCIIVRIKVDGFTGAML